MMSPAVITCWSGVVRDATLGMEDRPEAEIKRGEIPGPKI